MPSVATLAPKNNYSGKETSVEGMEPQLSYARTYVAKIFNHMGCVAPLG